MLPTKLHFLPNLQFKLPILIMSESIFSKLTDDVILKILFNVEEDPRNWARIACVSSKFSSLIHTICWRNKCSQAIPSVVSDLLSTSATVADWAALYKIAVCCPGLDHAGLLLENSDFGLERELGPDNNYQLSGDLSGLVQSPTPMDDLSAVVSGSDCAWSLYDDLYYDTQYDASESQEGAAMEIGEENPRAAIEISEENPRAAIEISEENPRAAMEINEENPPKEDRVKTTCDSSSVCKRRKTCRSLRSHMASAGWNLSREQGNKLLASRLRGDCLYISDWPGCVHIDEKRNYMLFRGIFKNFKRSRVWRTINDGDRNKIDLECAYCPCKQTWDLHSAFCLKRVFGYHDDGEPVVRAYVCENGHVSGAWTDWPLYT